MASQPEDEEACLLSSVCSGVGGGVGGEVHWWGEGDVLGNQERELLA